MLQRCLSPPPAQAISSALGLLRDIGAFSAGERLTSLGAHLNRMPLDPRVAKLLVYGAMLGCLDPALTVAAALGHGRPVFLSLPPAMQVRAQQRSTSFCCFAAHFGYCKAASVRRNAWVLGSSAGGRSGAPPRPADSLVAAAGEAVRQLLLLNQHGLLSNAEAVGIARLSELCPTLSSRTCFLPCWLSPRARFPPAAILTGMHKCLPRRRRRRQQPAPACLPALWQRAATTSLWWPLTTAGARPRTRVGASSGCMRRDCV